MTFVLGIITARGGSKAVPGKNIVTLRDRPLIAYTVASALSSNCLNDTVLSTDSQEIANCSLQYGLSTGKLRPLYLSTDESKSIDVVIYEIEEYERTHGLTVDVVVLLQPTSPFRNSADIDGALKIFFEKENDSLISVCDANPTHPNNMYYFEGDNLVPVEKDIVNTRRQDYKPVYLRNGALYIATRSQIMEKRRFIGERCAAYFMPRERSVNIDEPFDLEFA